ncbi:hypothetical protein AYR62_14230 [Secundilactobacillus paracollinoides]|uniref:N-acetyltransferase domain-containing protein n=2 Tax=Secundilactobacillus paracollinoides TaxID=240427 RepID=A0A1B2IWZ3_9LACO|nr:GNAT family N-acetyltransferase [Secundilactobacillus paracollinoides]ANZ60752.1 hypothetical protein AYR61_04935 [Secundilactobacillus paracollinoides]ANZ65124.1 hypothetical protein AYR62_14230 [Secundilactobacillus paracollinoides]ANZ66596.1 hypothetical protein AYR63_05225 [Secundilactobacillus paracollinoides]KRL79157.1 hypothetical protein FC17_GL000615 [Secundilactobacillus paracollinoides DSM 15502 = JCM 11969]
MALFIREMKTEDHDTVAWIYQMDQAQFPWVAKPALTDFDRDSTGEYILVAELDGQVVGFASLYRLMNFIHLLFVDPNCRKQGVGHALIEGMRQQASGLITLKCVMANTEALKFYDKEGFVIHRENRLAVPANYTMIDTLEDRYWCRKRGE